VISDHGYKQDEVSSPCSQQPSPLIPILNLINLIHIHPVSLRWILILSSFVSPSFWRRFFSFVCLFSLIRATCLVHHTVLDFVTLRHGWPIQPTGRPHNSLRARLRAAVWGRLSFLEDVIDKE